jgi:hypothetical protein
MIIPRGHVSLHDVVKVGSPAILARVQLLRHLFYEQDDVSAKHR